MQGRLLRNASGRSAYSIAHYPLVAGVILFAIGTEEILAHPESVLGTPVRWAILGGLMIFLVSEAVMARLFTNHTAWERLVAIAALGVAGIALRSLSAAALGAVACVILVLMLGIETVRHRDALRQLR